MPLVLAPVGMAGLFARRGELQGVPAANAANVPFTLSTVGISSVEEVQAASSRPFWFQLYMIKDRGAVRELLERAMAAGCTRLVFTVDLPLPGMRHRDTHNGMFQKSLKGALARAWQLGTRPACYANSIGSAELLGSWTDKAFDPRQHGLYYVRVLEIPTPRWSTYDAVRAGLPLLEGVPATVQERAWSSPIWYSPSGT